MRFLLIILATYVNYAMANLDTTFQIRFNNVSTKQVCFSLMAIHEDGTRDTGVDIYIGYAQVGKTAVIEVDKCLSWKIEISSESDEYIKNHFIDNNTNAVTHLTKGAIIFAAGHHNYAINENFFIYSQPLFNNAPATSLKEIISGENRLPRNPTPIHGYLNLLEGSALIAKGLAGFIGVQSIHTVSHVLKPLTFKKTTQGIRFVINHPKAWFKKGICINTEEFSNIKKSAVRVSTSRV